MCRERGARGGPIDGVGEIDVEIGNDGLSLLSQVCRGRKVGLLDILQLTDQRLLRRAAGTGVPLDCALVDHDGESEAGMSFGLGHYEFCGLIDAVVRTVPIDDDAIDSAANHVRDLIVNLRRVRGAVADVHVVRFPEPQEQVSVDLGGCAGIKQRVDIYFADVAGSGVAIGLSDKTNGGAGIVRRLCGQRGRGNNGGPGRAYSGHGQQENCGKERLPIHLSSGAEEPRPCCRFFEGGTLRL